MSSTQTTIMFALRIARQFVWKLKLRYGNANQNWGLYKWQLTFLTQLILNHT